MSVVTDIKDAIKDLLEGTIGDGYTVTVGKLKVVENDRKLDRQRSVTEPRATYIELGDEVTEEDLANFAGEDYERKREFRVVVSYTRQPTTNGLVLDGTILDDDREILACLTDRKNLALVSPGWQTCWVSSAVEHRLDAEGYIVITDNVLNVTVGYLERLDA